MFFHLKLGTLFPTARNCFLLHEAEFLRQQYGLHAALKTEMSLRKVLTSANKALSLDLTVKMNTWLATAATRGTLKLTDIRKLMSSPCLSSVTSFLSPKPK